MKHFIRHQFPSSITRIPLIMFSVLYVDDEPGLLEIGKMFLESFGDLSVHTIESAPGALELLNQMHFDAIIADYQMPGMDGLEFLKQVRRHHGNVPFILFTGRGREEVVITALNQGADFYLQKGGDPQAQFAELAHKIRQAVRRRRTERALEESERRYRAVIESQTELICRYLPDGTLLFVNGAFCTYYKKPADQLVGSRNHHVVHPEDRERNRLHFSSLTAEHPVGSIEHRVVMADGSVRWQQWTDRAIFDEHNRIAEFLSVGRDITERRQMESALAENRDYLDQIFSSVQSGIVLIDAKTHEILDLNPAAAALMGIPREQALNRSCHRFICPAEEGRCPITDLGQRVDNAERELLTADGRRVPIIKYVVPFTFRNRECLLETFVDNTEQKESGDRLRRANEELTAAQDELLRRTEDLRAANASLAAIGEELRGKYEELRRSGQELRESEEKFRVLAESAPAAIAVYHDNRDVYVNEYAVLMTGYSRDEFYAMNFWDMIHPESREMLKGRGLARQRGEQIPSHYEVRYITKSGETRWADLSAASITFQGIPAGIAMLIDITDRKKAGEELQASLERRIAQDEELRAQYAELSRSREQIRESEEKFRALAENAPVAIGVIQDNRYVYMNSNLVRALGYTREEIASMDYWVHVREDQQAKIIADGAAWARGEPGPWINEIEYFTKSGERKWAVSTAAHILSGGRHAGIVAMVGITERKKAEEELRAANGQLTAAEEELRAQLGEVVQGGQRLKESEEMLRGILDNIQDVYYRSDRDGNLIMFSPSGARLLGYENAEEFLGQGIAEKVYAHPEDRAGFLEAIGRSGSVRDYEVNLRHRNGSVITISASSHYYYGPDGTVAGIEGIFRDITEKKRAEEELMRSENLYRTVFETTGAATILIGPGTTILRANASFEKLTALSREALENCLSWTSLIHPDDVEQMKEYHYARRRDPAGIPTVYECRLIDAEKNVHSCYVYVDVIPGTKNSIASLIDITPLKRAEEAVRQVNRKLNLLSGITRHDIKNQLGVLRGFLKLMEQAGMNAPLNLYCRRAAEATERISSLIQFTREYELLGSSAPSWQDLRSLVEAEVVQAPPGSFVVENTVPAGLEVFADPLIARVIHNLMDNTLRHGGTVSAIRISVRDCGKEKILVWADDGAGVPAEEKERIFGMGYGRHTGLGLALSREILSLTGLTIRECGEAGRGARFEITMPREAWRFAGR